MLFATLACGAIGFLDDFIKLTHRRSLGLSGRWKMLLLVVIAVIVSIVADHLQIQHSVFLPIVNVNIPLSYAWYPFLFLVIAGTANGDEPRRRRRRARGGNGDHRDLHLHGDQRRVVPALGLESPRTAT